MSYKSILLNLDIDGPAASLVKFAGDLASRFDARLIGFSAAVYPPPMVTAEGGMIFDGEIMQQQRESIERRLAELRKEFERLAGATDAEWRGAVGNPTYLLTDCARAADLVVTGISQGTSSIDAHRAVDPGNLILHAGRPVLVAADGQDRFVADRALVAWKDTREARRAVADALPLLQLAGEVKIITVDDAPDDRTWKSLADVAAFLSLHGIKADADVIAEKATIAGMAKAMNADLLISGAYGHSRLREWVFGGVTRSLLDEGGLNRFMSN
jgi:nucleotide-binding universal stress UspA family protein